MQHYNYEHLTNFSFSFSLYFALHKPVRESLCLTEFSSVQIGQKRTATSSGPTKKTSLCYRIIVHEHSQLINLYQVRKRPYLNMIILNNWVTCACGLVSCPFPLCGLPWLWLGHLWKQNTRRSFSLFAFQENNHRGNSWLKASFSTPISYITRSKYLSVLETTIYLFLALKKHVQVCCSESFMKNNNLRGGSAVHRWKHRTAELTGPKSEMRSQEKNK